MTGAQLRNDRGLTLVEILLAVAVIGIVLAALGVVLPVSSYGIHDGRQLSTATFLAEQMVERTRAARWTSEPAVDCLGASVGDAAPVPTGATCRDLVATPFPDEADGVAGSPQYRRIVRITSCEAGGCGGVSPAGLRLVEVTVAYTAPGVWGSAPGVRTVELAWLASPK